MKKTSFKLFLVTALALAGVSGFSLLPDAEVSAQAQNDLVVETTGYSVLSPSSFVFWGYYSGNTAKKPLTTYFEFKKDSNNLNTGAEETIKIIRDKDIKEFNDFYSSPELKLFSTYYFRGVGYYNDNPSQKFYGEIISLKTFDFPVSYINPTTGEVIPFTIKANEIAKPYVPPVCAPTEFLTNGVCEKKPISSPVCILPQILDFSTNTCIIPSTLVPTVTISANPDRVTYNGRSTIVWSSTNATSCIANGDWSGIKATSGIYPTGPLTSSKAYAIRCTAGERTSYLVTAVVVVDASAPPPPTAGSGSGSGSGGKESGLVPCGTEYGPDGKIANPCKFEHIFTLIKTVMDFIFKNIVLPLSAIMFAYAGFLLVTSGGETSKKEKAKKIFTNVAIGLIIVVAAWLIVNTVLSIVGYTGMTFLKG